MFPADATPLRNGSRENGVDRQDTVGKVLVSPSTKRTGWATAMLKTAEETETDGGDDTKQRLAGHFLRGHAGSVAYDFACDGATWGVDEGINRARHYYRRTSSSFRGGEK